MDRHRAGATPGRVVHPVGSLPWIGTLAMWVLGPRLRLWPSSTFGATTVDRVFFEVRRRETPRPAIVCGGGTAESFAQVAVLLSGEELRAGFEWFGTVDDLAQAHLHAAGVRVVDAHAPAERAARMAGAWICLAQGDADEAPSFLAEALASGMPCLAFDCAAHRALIRDGVTGCLYRTEHDMIDRIAMLLDEPATRLRLGRAARADATRRFISTTPVTQDTP